MTTNSKIGLGVGMVAVFATFVIGMYGMQSSKVASVGSYNNSAAALNTPTAQEGVVTTGGNMKTAVVSNQSTNSAQSYQKFLTTVQNAQPASAPCGQLSVGFNPISPTSIPSGTNSMVKILDFTLKNVSQCTLFINSIEFPVISRTGAASFYWPKTLTNVTTGVSYTIEEPHPHDFDLLFTNFNPQDIVLSPGQSMQFKVESAQFYNTLTDKSFGWADFFSVGIGMIPAQSANNVYINRIDKFGPQFKVQ